MFSFDYYGKITPKGRPRFGKRRARTPKHTKKFEEALALRALVARGTLPPISGPVGVEIVACYQCPKSKDPGDPCYGGGGRGDLDNVIKAVNDALNGVLYEDDRQIVSISARQQYAPKGHDEHISIIVREES